MGRMKDIAIDIDIANQEIDETLGFFWNYRIVNLKSQNGGEDWYCLQEVYYDMQDKPTGYLVPCLSSESMEGMRDVWDMMSEAMELPPLQEEDFPKWNEAMVLPSLQEVGVAE